MATPPADDLETLLASALAAHADGGDAALAAFLAAHPARRAAIERGLQCCRRLGLIAAESGSSDGLLGHAIAGAADHVAVSPPSTNNASREMPR
jgi:hypothetical protein